MALLLIDDQGHLWDGASRTLRASFDSPYSGGEFSDYAVTNLGFVAANAYGGSCQIRLRPNFVTDAAHKQPETLVELGAHRPHRPVVARQGMAS